MSLHTRVYAKCHNISFCSKIKTDLKISHQLTGPLGIVRRPLGTYLDDITWMKPLCLQSTPVTTPVLTVQALTLSSVQTALLTPAKLALNSLPGLKSPDSKIQSLWGGHTVTRLQVLPQDALRELGTDLCYLKNKSKATNSFTALKSSSSLLLFS